MIKVIIEIDETDSEALQRILEITGIAGEIQVDDPKFPDRIVNQFWFKQNWPVNADQANSLVGLRMTPRKLKRIALRGDLQAIRRGWNMQDVVYGVIKEFETQAQGTAELLRSLETEQREPIPTS